MTGSIPILTYHHVTPEDLPSLRKYVVTPSLFAAQMRWLARHGYTSVGLDAVIGPRTNLPRRPVVITFDDGYRTCVKHAVPILERFGFQAVFFLVAGLMGASSRWLRNEVGLDLPLIDWPTARRLEADGFACGSHTVSHPRLADLAADACRQELTESRARLEDELGHPVRDLAYPFGSFDARVRAIVQEVGYRSACAETPGRSQPGDDHLALRRIRVRGEDSLFDFMLRVVTGFSAREWLRRA
jgi:peptidoglycan/xylan/chitin deacetylase (PgdA/CDA1 family)